MAKFSRSLLLLLAAALAALPATVCAAKKKAPVTKIKPVGTSKADAAPSLETPAATALPGPKPAVPAATPRPRMDDLEQILARSDTEGLPLAARGAIVI